MPVTEMPDKRKPCDAQTAYEDNFLPYVKDWVRAVKKAAQEKKGICFGFGG